MNNERHNWTFDEDFICAKIYIYYLSKNFQNINLKFLTEKVKQQLHQIPDSSIRMRLQNIHAVIIEKGIRTPFSFKALKHYANNTRLAVEKVLQNSIIN